jgi:DNA-binding transcriptional MerR regulator
MKKAYYSIGEVCELTGLKPHVLRYWETQFQALQPSKNRAGNRVYRPKEIELVLLVKKLLYDEKYTIEGADRKIREMRRGGDLPEERRDAVAPELLSGIRDELHRLRAILTPPDPGSGSRGNQG